jgi:hypothetical protein
LAWLVLDAQLSCSSRKSKQRRMQQRVSYANSLGLMLSRCGDLQNGR